MQGTARSGGRPAHTSSRPGADTGRATKPYAGTPNGDAPRKTFNCEAEREHGTLDVGAGATAVGPKATRALGSLADGDPAMANIEAMHQHLRFLATALALFLVVAAANVASTPAGPWTALYGPLLIAVGPVAYYLAYYGGYERLAAAVAGSGDADGGRSSTVARDGERNEFEKDGFERSRHRPAATSDGATAGDSRTGSGDERAGGFRFDGRGSRTTDGRGEATVAGFEWDAAADDGRGHARGGPRGDRPTDDRATAEAAIGFEGSEPTTAGRGGFVFERDATDPPDDGFRFGDRAGESE
jgi:hypothetical protein